MFARFIDWLFDLNNPKKFDQTCHIKTKRMGKCTRRKDGYCAECHADYY